MHLLLQPPQPVHPVDGGDSYPPMVGREGKGAWKLLRVYYERSSFDDLAIPLVWGGDIRPEAFDYLCRVLLRREGFRGKYGVGLIQRRPDTWDLLEDHRPMMTYSALPMVDENRVDALAGIDMQERALAFIVASRVHGCIVHEVFPEGMLEGDKA